MKDLNLKYRWLCELECCSWSLEKNEHASNYITADAWIESSPELFDGVGAAEQLAMIETNTIWRLQIYPDTPIGFYTWFGATMDSVITAAMRDWKSKLAGEA